MSILVPYFLKPRKSSGGRYQRVTTMLVYSGALGSGFDRVNPLRIVLARPKSAILSSPVLSIRILAALRSRWIILFCGQETMFSTSASRA